MNKDLIENFIELQNYFRSINDRGRIIAYGKAIAALRIIDVPITNVSQVKGVRGIGPKITAKIKEFLDTGQIRAAQEKKEELRKVSKKSIKEQTIQEFTTIWGIGPSKARSLYKKGIRNIAQLKKNQQLLTRQQIIGLKYYKDLKKKVPRQMITVMYTVFVFFLNRKFGRSSYKLEIAGSYRRGKAQSGDIDCLITSQQFTLKDVVDLFREKNVIVETLSTQKTKFMGIAHCPSGGQYIRLDIEFIPEESWGSGNLYFTGSRGTNVYMRSIAKQKGYTLNEYGIFNTRTGTRAIKSPSEEDIFRILDLNYIPPERR